MLRSFCVLLRRPATPRWDILLLSFCDSSCCRGVGVVIVLCLWVPLCRRALPGPGGIWLGPFVLLCVALPRPGKEDIAAAAAAAEPDQHTVAVHGLLFPAESALVEATPGATMPLLRLKLKENTNGNQKTTPEPLGNQKNHSRTTPGPL